ncbi:MAG TPA: hypothetical protein DHW22_06455 [Planctomycetaceae bacterium]|nr:hypothetical protein [Planctomycetaceae bacterium]
MLGYEPGTPLDEIDFKLKIDVSPISFVSKDDPPVLLVHGDQDNIVPVEHAFRMQERIKGAGVAVELVIVEGVEHSVSKTDPQTSCVC